MNHTLDAPTTCCAAQCCYHEHCTQSCTGSGKDRSCTEDCSCDSYGNTQCDFACTVCQRGVLSLRYFLSEEAYARGSQWPNSTCPPDVDGCRISQFTRELGDNPSSASHFVSKYTVGSQFDCWYKRDDPSKVILSEEHSYTGWKWFLTAPVMLTMLLLAMALTYLPLRGWYIREAGHAARLGNAARFGLHWTALIWFGILIPFGMLLPISMSKELDWDDQQIVCFVATSSFVVLGVAPFLFYLYGSYIAVATGFEVTSELQQRRRRKELSHKLAESNDMVLWVVDPGRGRIFMDAKALEAVQDVRRRAELLLGCARDSTRLEFSSDLLDEHQTLESAGMVTEAEIALRDKADQWDQGEENSSTSVTEVHIGYCSSPSSRNRVRRFPEMAAGILLLASWAGPIGVVLPMEFARAEDGPLRAWVLAVVLGTPGLCSVLWLLFARGHILRSVFHIRPSKEADDEPRSRANRFARDVKVQVVWVVPPQSDKLLGYTESFD
eukprot:TRINITY_DN4227_c0_g1_i1.p1 TRINITY_DN4227_c0_g1~~TRINITY_DN4227_c0_g1_i1.p1  ORF type:complete len:496 (-),score=118.59 TRINITY_DN4227_c0_g1_i1:146-1633(-)